MPRDVSQLRSLLGGLSYYHQYLPNLAQNLKPLTTLLKEGVKFVFTSEMEKIVREQLDTLSKPPILVFHTGQPLKMAPVHSDCTRILPKLGLALHWNRSNKMLVFAPLYI